MEVQSCPFMSVDNSNPDRVFIDRWISVYKGFVDLRKTQEAISKYFGLNNDDDMDAFFYAVERALSDGKGAWDLYVAFLSSHLPTFDKIKESGSVSSLCEINHLHEMTANLIDLIKNILKDPKCEKGVMRMICRILSSNSAPVVVLQTVAYMYYEANYQNAAFNETTTLTATCCILSDERQMKAIRNRLRATVQVVLEKFFGSFGERVSNILNEHLNRAFECVKETFCCVKRETPVDEVIKHIHNFEILRPLIPTDYSNKGTDQMVELIKNALNRIKNELGIVKEDGDVLSLRHYMFGYCVFKFVSFPSESSETLSGAVLDLLEEIMRNFLDKLFKEKLSCRNQELHILGKMYEFMKQNSGGGRSDDETYKLLSKSLVVFELLKLTNFFKVAEEDIRKVFDDFFEESYIICNKELVRRDHCYEFSSDLLGWLQLYRKGGKSVKYYRYVNNCGFYRAPNFPWHKLSR